ncbi:hypothetical protein JCGZ_03903 [Jatropha curcas]|uniref:Uncharacterized protein n=1 Tax=Jatropha curcas TaxID=180498 RepID=A0A067LQ80_JATCU|nr:hypothetical protein JCGZ_03903 [Jatropha curcas]
MVVVCQRTQLAYLARCDEAPGNLEKGYPLDDERWNEVRHMGRLQGWPAVDGLPTKYESWSRRYSHTTSDVAMFLQLLNGLSWDRLLIHIPPLTEFDPFAEAEELAGGQGATLVQVSIYNYNEVCQLYEAARLKLAVARLSNEHISRASVVPPASQGRGITHGGRASHGVGHRPLIIEEAEESSGDDSEEMTSNMS